MTAPENRIYRPLRLSRLDRALGLAPKILAILFGAIAVHLILLLALPALWPASAYRALAAKAPLGAPWLAPQPGFNPQDRDGGFSDPFAALAICRFDLRRGPLRLTAAADGERPFSLSIRLIDGAILYSSNDRQTPRGRFDVLILTQAQADAQDKAEEARQDEGSGDATTTQAASADGQNAEAPPAETSKPDAPLRLIAPAPRGFALFRLLARNEADYPAAAAGRAAIGCALTPEP